MSPREDRFSPGIAQTVRGSNGQIRDCTSHVMGSHILRNNAARVDCEAAPFREPWRSGRRLPGLSDAATALLRSASVTREISRDLATCPNNRFAVFIFSQSPPARMAPLRCPISFRSLRPPPCPLDLVAVAPFPHYREPVRPLIDRQSICAMIAMPKQAFQEKSGPVPKTAIGLLLSEKIGTLAVRLMAQCKPGGMRPLAKRFEASAAKR